LKRIGILSDTHGFLHDDIFKYFEECNEIWHAGDIGSIEVADKLNEFRFLKAVWGNIDNHTVRITYPEIQQFACEEVRVIIKHIVGYPGKYEPGIKDKLLIDKPDLLVAGHSHILKVQFDKKNDFLFINPGAAGKTGFHKVATLVRLTIDGKKMKDLEVIELR
jgi:uncharacterized protein